MPRLKIDLDDQIYEKLVQAAVSERRPIVWQAEVTLQRALGLPFPDMPDASQREVTDARAAR